MAREIGPLPAFLFSWLLAAVLGATCLLWTFRRAGMPGRKIAAVWSMNIAAIVVGSKLLFLLEAWWTSSPIQGNFLGNSWGSFWRLLLSPRMRVPGGILFAVLVGPCVARIVGARFPQLADLAVPGGAVSLVAIRIGCFLEGCCFGPVSHLPWAVRFPRPTEAFAWQVNQRLIPASAPSSLPVHPLQLYFAAAALVIAVALLILQERKRFEGELLLVFLVAYLWSTGLLEILRARPHEVARSAVLTAAVACSLLAAFVEWKVRRTPSATGDPAGS